MLILVDNKNKIVKYPYTIENLKEDNPNTSFPSSISDETLKDFNVYNVNGQPPTFDPYVKVEEVDPHYKDGAWHRSFKTRDATPEEVLQLADIEINKVISKRNDLLKECDWTQLPDADLTDAEVSNWKIYRQSLRDMTNSKGYPWKVTWPESPNIKSKLRIDSPQL